MESSSLLNEDSLLQEESCSPNRGMPKMESTVDTSLSFSGVDVSVIKSGWSSVSLFCLIKYSIMSICRCLAWRRSCRRRSSRVHREAILLALTLGLLLLWAWTVDAVDLVVETWELVVELDILSICVIETWALSGDETSGVVGCFDLLKARSVSLGIHTSLSSTDSFTPVLDLSSHSVSVSTREAARPVQSICWQTISGVVWLSKQYDHKFSAHILLALGCSGGWNRFL